MQWKNYCPNRRLTWVTIALLNYSPLMIHKIQNITSYIPQIYVLNDRSGPDGLAGDLIKRKSDWDLEEEKLFREREAEHQISTQRGDTDAEAVSYLREEMLCISAFFFLVIISRILSAKRQKRNVYIFKSNKWRDEYGYRVAVVASVLVESKKNDVAFLPSAPDKKKQANNSQSVEEDFWLLLMSEVEPPVEFTEGGIRKTKNVSKRKKPCK